MENVFLVLTDDRFINLSLFAIPLYHIFSSTPYLRKTIVKLFEDLL